MKALKITLFAVWIIVFVAAGFLIFTIYSSKHSSVVSAPQNRITLNADKIFALVNQERTNQGLPLLQRNSKLDATAQIRANDMVIRKYFSHFDPVTGESLVNIQKENPGMCMKAGENISGHYRTNEEVVNGWMNSKPHHDAILEPKFNLAGMAVSNNDIVVLHFCEAI